MSYSTAVNDTVLYRYKTGIYKKKMFGSVSLSSSEETEVVYSVTSYESAESRLRQS